MAKQYSVTYDGYNRWLMPLNLAIGLHLLIAFSVIFLPGMFKGKPKFEDIYTVNLVTLNEPPAQQASPTASVKPAEPPPVAKLEKVEPKTVNLDPEPVPAPEPAAPVSLKPLKRKIKKEITPTEKEPRTQDAERLRRQRLAEALRAEQEAAEQAQLAEEEAARQQRLLDQQLASVKRQDGRRASTSQTSGGSASTLSFLEKQYLAAIVNRISQFWALPEFRRWDPETKAVVVISVSQNGTIIKQFFEKRSTDPTFDQFVRKALQDADPLPAIPPALRKNNFEIGLVFSPGSIN